MWCIGIFFSLLVLTTSADQNGNDEYSLSSKNIADLRLKMSAMGNILEGLERNRDRLEQKSFPFSCAASMWSTKLVIRVPEYSEYPFKVVCDQRDFGGGWTVFYRRIDGSEDFNRNWTEYKNGFGHLNNDFFLGFDKLHAITYSEAQELMVLLEDSNTGTYRIRYNHFKIGPEQSNYTLESLGSFLGESYVVDFLTDLLGMQFRTKECYNDASAKKCVVKFHATGWDRYCEGTTYPNGLFGVDDKVMDERHMRILSPYHSAPQRKITMMMIRPQNSYLNRDF
ncbi:ficolin-1-like isoform X1 [Drosophila takahashii]|uniref:ficolin-1-like isoform X1 n=2 Tax=Drosophila takahashii TaxID=29030 RepID=UPI0038995745